MKLPEVKNIINVIPEMEIKNSVPDIAEDKTDELKDKSGNYTAKGEKEIHI